MQTYIDTLLLTLDWPKRRKRQLSPFIATPIAYGQKMRLTPEDDTSAPLSAERLLRVQKIIGSLLYYTRAVDNKLLVALNAIAARQSKATIHTEQLVHTLLDYVATYPNDGIVYRASNMVLCAHADARYLNETKSRSRAGAHIYLSEDDPSPRFNGALLTIATIINLSWPRLPRQNLLHYSSLHAKWYPTTKPSSTWDGHNHAAPFKPTIQRQLGLQTRPLSPRGPK